MWPFGKIKSMKFNVYNNMTQNGDFPGYKMDSWLEINQNVNRSDFNERRITDQNLYPNGYNITEAFEHMYIPSTVTPDEFVLYDNVSYVNYFMPLLNISEVHI